MAPLIGSWERPRGFVCKQRARPRGRLARAFVVGVSSFVVGGGAGMGSSAPPPRRFLLFCRVDDRAGDPAGDPAGDLGAYHGRACLCPVVGCASCSASPLLRP